MTKHLRVGIVGLGDMGGGMAERLLAAGFPLTGWNRTRAKAERFVERGMTLAQTPREVAERSDLIISMVTDNAALDAVLEGPDGVLAGLRPGTILAEMSTTSPTRVRALAERVAERGAQLLDAPVLGSILTLRQGNLLVMVGGPREAYERAEPAFAAIGSTVRHVGEVGQAKALKLAANLNLAVQVVAFSEGIVLAEKMGVDRAVALETLLGGVIASPALKYRMPFVLQPPDYAWFCSSRSTWATSSAHRSARVRRRRRRSPRRAASATRTRISQSSSTRSRRRPGSRAIPLPFPRTQARRRRAEQPGVRSGQSPWRPPFRPRLCYTARAGTTTGVRPALRVRVGSVGRSGNSGTWHVLHRTGAWSRDPCTPMRP
jgi:3-hydroxyisobutyrate dehydrogenase-like beta-hydroxyacid dehydrogenase